MNTKRIAAFFAVLLWAAASGAAQNGPTLVNGFFRQEGIASWYGTEFDGRPTASGESFNSSLFTAAHPSLPFGTMLRITNRHNNRQVVVKVNDRGPFVSARIIDLSQAAAQQLDMINTGTAPVLVESLGPLNLSSLQSIGEAVITSSSQITAPELAPLPPEDFPVISQNAAPLSPSAPAQQPYPVPPVYTAPVQQTYPVQPQQPAYPAQQTQQAYPAPTPQPYPAQPQAGYPAPGYLAPAQQPVQPQQPAYPAPTQRAYPVQPQAGYPVPGYPAPAQQPVQPQQPTYPAPQAQQTYPAPGYPAPTQQPVQPQQPAYPAPQVQQPYPAPVPVIPEVAPRVPAAPSPSAPATRSAMVPRPPAKITGVIPVLGTNKTYRIQIGAYRNPRNAAEVFDKLKNVGLNAAYERSDDVYRVVLARVRAEEVQGIAEKLGMAGFPEAMIREE